MGLELLFENLNNPNFSGNIVATSISKPLYFYLSNL